MKNTMKELTEGMQRLCAVANRIVVQNGHASRIEIDLLLEDLRGLYDIALQLSGDALPKVENGEREEEGGTRTVESEDQMMAMMSAMAAMSTVPETDSPKEFSPVAAPEKEDVLIEKEAEVESVPEPEKPEEPAPEPEAEPQELPQMEELEQNGNELLFDEIVIEPEPTPEPKVEEPGAGSREPEARSREEKREPVAQVGQASLLDYLSQNTTRTLGESLGADRPQPTSLEKKVDDLRTVININDKFSFMSELFHNNMKAYNDFIMRLNAIALRDEALAHVQEVAAQYKWDDNSPAVQTFYKIFDKKF